MKNTHILLAATSLLLFSCKSAPYKDALQGKTEREQIGVVSKLPGKIIAIYVQEGEMVHAGDTLAILDIPEVEAKKNQAEGAVLSATAQYQMAVKGATDNQMKQLEAKHSALKEQFEFAQKSFNRVKNLLADSLVSQQTYDETYAKYQGALSQYNAVQAELADAQKGARAEQQTMARGQQERAKGALKEVEVAEEASVIIAPRDMIIESITLLEGEMALPGYTLFTGSITESTYFRFTLAESQLNQYKINQPVKVKVLYNGEVIAGKISVIKQLAVYANISSAYPDYNLQESLFEMKVVPDDINAAKNIYTKTNVILEPSK